MSLDRIQSLVAGDFEAVNQLIIETIQSQVGLIDDLSSHIVNSGGKRIRPLLLLLASRACGYSGNDHITLAAMVEFFHTATLLHDDVVDESSMRRGRETANAIWGSKASILVGDFLFTQSVQLMIKVGNMDVLTMMGDSSHTISCGEVKQLANRHNPSLSFEDYMEVIQAKTAILFAAATGISALISSCDKDFVEAMYAYGLHMGNAFQIIDDVLDYDANAEHLGKNVGDDLADGKATLPLIRAYQLADAAQRRLIEDSLREGKRENLSQIQAIIQDTDAINFSIDYAKAEIEKSLQGLQGLEQSPYKDALEALAQFALYRAF